MSLFGMALAVELWGDAELEAIDDPLNTYPIRPVGDLEAVADEDERDAHRSAFDRWLDEHGADSVFQGGVVTVDREPPTATFVLVAVTSSDFAFFNEGGTEDDAMSELGRFARSSVKSVDVTDLHDQHVPEPATESVDEPDALAKVVVSWQTEGGQPERDEFAFRSAWAAWEAAHRFRRFAQPPLLA